MFSQFFIGHPRFAIVLSLVLVLLGGISLSKLPVAEYPEVTPPQLYVSASYTGASADVVMQTVAIPLEDSINGVDDLLYFSSTCGNDGDYSCTVTFKSGTDSDIAMVNLQNAVKRAEAKLPSEVTKTGVTVEKRGSDILAMFVFLSDGTSMDIMELGNYVDTNIKNAVTRLDGVASADIMSQKEYSMRIWLDPLRMAGLNISTSDITNAIENQNIQAAAGNIGSLCDDAIVVVENTQSLMTREGLNPVDAAKKSMRQITGAIIATTLVTVACYVPLAFYGGIVGNIYIQFAVTMCIALCLSTVIAMTLSPVLCAYLLKRPSDTAPWFFKPFNAVLDCSRSGYLFFVRALVRRGALTLVLFVLLLLSAWLLSGRIPSSFLPQEDKGTIMCNIELPNSASHARTEEVLEEFRESIEDIKGIDSILLISGMSMISARGENVAMGIIMLKNWKERNTPETQMNAIIREIQKRTSHITSARIVCMTPPAIMGLGVVGGANFELCSIGETDTTQLSETSKKVAMALTQDPAIQYATSAFNADTPQVYLAIDRRKAESLGLSANAIFSALQSNFASVYVNDFTMKGQNYEVKIQASPKDRCSLNNISTLQIRSSKDEMIPLSSVATLRYAVGPNQIMRFNKMVCAEMNAAAATGVSSAALIRRIEALQLPANYQVQWVGQSYQEKQNEGRIVFLMAFAIIFAYLFLVAQYESWSIPISVMLTVGTAILGALLGLWVCGTHVGKWLGVADTASLSIYAQLGMVMLIGLTAKNAILMVEFSKQERENGKSIFDAAVNGANLRYRAVLMTALSFLFGVFPLVIATGAGAGSRRAIGITTFSGMLLATVVGIVFTPALYAVFQRMREWVKNTLHRRQTELRKC